MGRSSTGRSRPRRTTAPRTRHRFGNCGADGQDIHAVDDDPRHTVRLNALRKNAWCRARHPDRPVLTADTVVVFAGPGIANPNGITVGPDGNLWFTNYGNRSIGRITTKVSS